MKLSKELTTVTPLSKILAAILFISLPFVGFFLGMQYQETVNLAKSQQGENNVSISRVPTPTAYAIPTVDPSITANWKTYTNTKYGFEFKYPADHTVYSDVDQKKEALISATSTSDIAKIASIEEHLFCCEPTTLSFSIKSTTKTAREWVDEHLKSVPEWEQEGELPIVKDTSFAGKSVVEANGRGGYGPPHRIIVVPLKNSLLEIMQDSNDVLLSQILSTFKFTD